MKFGKQHTDPEPEEKAPEPDPIDDAPAAEATPAEEPVKRPRMTGYELKAKLREDRRKAKLAQQAA